jgi:predicted nucleotidyltransferase
MAAEGLELMVSQAEGTIRRYRDPELGVALDLLLAEVPLEEAVVAQATELPFGDLSVRVARVEELLALKILASRSGSDDLRDARLLAAVGEGLDVDAVRDHLRAFGPEYVARLEELVAGD